MGKCILAGHPQAGGQIGYGTYKGDYAETRKIDLGVTPKWVLVFTSKGFAGLSNAQILGGLAVAGSPNEAITITNGGFLVYCKGTNMACGTNRGDQAYYNYIYGY